MRPKILFSNLLFLALFLALAPAAMAGNTWYVDGVHGNDRNSCKSPQTACKTIGHAISLAKSSDSIRVAAATYKENLTISFSLNVIGAGATATIVDGGGVATVFSVSGANVNLSGMTIRHGARGIGNTGTLTLSASTVSGNFTGGWGGGVSNAGVLTINNSTISGNQANDPSCHLLCNFGGGIFSNNSSKLTINNSTISGNFGHTGGAIYGLRATVTINNSTISGNTAKPGSGGIVSYGGTATLQNTIVANNSGRNCFGTFTSNGYNLSSDGSCAFNNTGDLNNTNPNLGPLQNNGGPTQTMALLSGSPAIDAGNPKGCTDGQGHLLKTDQRGDPRPDKEDSSGCDMGAYESQKD